MNRTTALSNIRNLVECGDCMDCCADTRNRGRSLALLRVVERQRFGTSESRVAEPCQFCLSPNGCGLESDPARPIACDLYPLFPTRSAGDIAVHLWCPQAQAIPSGKRARHRGQCSQSGVGRVSQRTQV